MPPQKKETQRRRPVTWIFGTVAVVAIALLMYRYGRFFSTSKLGPPSVAEALDPHKGTLLAPLLKPRVPGTPGAIEARDHIAKHLKNFGWTVDIHRFDAKTPIGAVPMANIVSRRASSGLQTKKPKLTIAAHYDSKKTPEGFIGAIDSAFPCALLMWIASLPDPQRDFDLIFFDGEEAFKEWSDDDSLYGARALAELQNNTGSLPSTLVLLDLIGHDSRFPLPSWFPQTKHLHAELARIDPRLVGGRDLHEYAGMMLDDHIPFMKLGVPVLHLIPPSFPPEWHTVHDNAEILHWPTMEAWAELLRRWLY